MGLIQNYTCLAHLHPILSGGDDIDLRITINGRQNLRLKQKVMFLAGLKRRIGDQRIDVVLDNENYNTLVKMLQLYPIADLSSIIYGKTVWIIS